MILLTIRTDKPVAELGLYDNTTQLAYEVWEAHRALGTTMHAKLAELLEKTDTELEDIEGIVCFQGPGSFTGLRIGLTVANALSYALHIPIVASRDPHWLETGITGILSGATETIALPFYGSEAHITPQKK